MFSKIKGPLKRLAKNIQAQIRHYWYILTDAESAATSWFETTIMPIWNFLVSVFVIVQRIFHRPAKESVIDETTPLLEDGGPETEREIERLRTPAPAIIIRSGVPVKPLEIRVNPIFDLSHNATVETFFYSVEPYCVVCRKEFYKDNVNDPEGMWDNCLIASELQYPLITRQRAKFVF